MFTGMPEGGAIPDAGGGGPDEAAACGERAAAALGGTRFGDVRWSAVTGSTNADALAFYAAGGFVEVDRRPRYYRDGSTAIVLRRPLAGGCG